MSDSLDKIVDPLELDTPADIVLENFIKGTTDVRMKVFTDDYVKATQEHIVVVIKKYVAEYFKAFGSGPDYIVLQDFVVAMDYWLANPVFGATQLKQLGVDYSSVVDHLVGVVNNQRKYPGRVNNTKPKLLGNYNKKKPLGTEQAEKIKSFLEHIQYKRNQLGYTVENRWEEFIDACRTIDDVNELFDRIDSVHRAGSCTLQKAKMREEADEIAKTYKIICFCSNCGADKIKLHIPKGTKADDIMNERACPKCKCSNSLLRDMSHTTLGSVSK